MVLTEADTTAAPIAATASDLAEIEVVRDLDAAKPLWLHLERDAACSPYQRLAWVEQYLASGVEESEPAIAIVRVGGRVVMLLPFAITTIGGLRTASFVGGRHANYKLPLRVRDFATDAREERSLLLAVGRALRVDALTIDSVPRFWEGQPVPWAALGLPAASNAYALPLAEDGEATLRGAMRPDSRRKLRNKENTLAKQGRLAFLRAGDAAELDRVLRDFFRQKNDRFREQGISDPFVGAGAAFVRAAAADGIGTPRAAIEVSALLLDDRVIAAFGAAVDPVRASGMFISFDPEFARYSPGDQLVARVIADNAARGRTVFDLGLGEAEYKNRFCTVVEEMVDVTVPVSLKGNLVAAGRSALAVAKRRLKRSDRAMALIKAARREIARRRG